MKGNKKKDYVKNSVLCVALLSIFSIVFLNLEKRNQMKVAWFLQFVLSVCFACMHVLVFRFPMFGLFFP